MDTEQRRHPRVDTRVDAHVVAEGAAVDTRIFDLSHGGARAAQVQGVHEGDQVQLFVALPIPFRHRRRYCLFDATVKWIVQGKMGLEFDVADLETFAQLELGLEALEAQTLH